ncbi:bifunctional DNA primase/polymerase [Candidatus Binatus sp.]|uniref:bifunctional DNA primase/polymerase n=1 Tax=Candidatus Binatus sp. TaxID=2811406 RepID=UPI003C4244E3
MRPTLRRLRRILDHLAEHNLWAFPIACSEAGKLPLVKWRDFQSQPPSDGEVADWCRRFPDAGAAIPTGLATKIFVVDADSADAIEWLEMRGMPVTVLVRTRKGLHYYFRCPGIEVRNSAGALAPGIDVRGTGGMAVAAGTHNQGFEYQYDSGHALGEVAIADAPDWLIDWLLQEQVKRQVAVMPLRPQEFDGHVGAWARKIIDDELGELAAATEGCRNDRLSRTAFKLGQLAGGGEADATELRAALHAIADAWPNPSHSHDTIARCLEAGLAHPRQRPLRDVVWIEPATEAAP